MVEKKKYYKQKLQEKKIEILKTIIEEEIDLLIAENSEYHGLSKLRDPNTFTGMLGSLVKPLITAPIHGATKIAIQLAGIVGLTIAGSIMSLLPFNDPRTVGYVAKKIQYWEQENLKSIDKQFEKELAEMWSGWETFKTDFWGISFVYSPMNAIAAIATAGKGIDMGLSILNVVSAGKVEEIINNINGEISDPGSIENYLRTTGKTSRKSSTDSTREKDIKSYLDYSNKQQDSSNDLLEAFNSKSEKTGIESLNQLHQKIENWVKEGKINREEANEFFDQLKNRILKDPKVNQAANKWSAATTAKMMTNIFTNVNNDIVNGKAGKVSPQEIQAYKANGPKMVSEIFKSLSRKSKKFKPVPTQAVLKAAQQAVTTSMATMPNQLVTAQPQQSTPQTAVTPQLQQPTPTTTKSR